MSFSAEKPLLQSLLFVDYLCNANITKRFISEISITQNMIRYYSQRITIIKARMPRRGNINEELQWLGNSLGLFNLRDKDKSCFRIFIQLLKSAKTKNPITSDEIANKTELSRGTVIHHINRLMESGIVVHEKNKYVLRVNNLSELINEVERDILRACDDLKKVAEEIDRRIGM